MAETVATRRCRRRTSAASCTPRSRPSCPCSTASARGRSWPTPRRAPGCSSSTRGPAPRTRPRWRCATTSRPARTGRSRCASTPRRPRPGSRARLVWVHGGGVPRRRPRHAARPTGPPARSAPAPARWSSASSTGSAMAASPTRCRTTTSSPPSAGCATTPRTSGVDAGADLRRWRQCRREPRRRAPRSGCGTTTRGSRVARSSPIPSPTRRSRRLRRPSPRAHGRPAADAALPPGRHRASSPPTTWAGHAAGPTATPCPAWRSWTASVRCWCSTPSSTTCGPRARRSPRQLAAAGVDVRHVSSRGLPHGFLNQPAAASSRSTARSTLDGRSSSAGVTPNPPPPGLQPRPEHRPRRRRLLPGHLDVRVPAGHAGVPEHRPGRLDAHRQRRDAARAARIWRGADAGRACGRPPSGTATALFYVIVTVGSAAAAASSSRATDPAGPWSDGTPIAGGRRHRPRPRLGRRRHRLRHVSPLLPAPIRQVRVDLTAGAGARRPRAPVVGHRPVRTRRARTSTGAATHWYLVVAEGGTDRGHAVSVARGPSPAGPFEGHPANPVLSARSTERAGAEHRARRPGETPDGGTAMVLLGVRPVGVAAAFSPLGRETFMTGVDWVDGWPQADRWSSTRAPESRSRSSTSPTPRCSTTRDGWRSADARPEVASVTDGRLVITGDGGDLYDCDPCLVGRRQRHLTATVVDPGGRLRGQPADWPPGTTSSTGSPSRRGRTTGRRP